MNKRLVWMAAAAAVFVGGIGAGARVGARGGLPESQGDAAGSARGGAYFLCPPGTVTIPPISNIAQCMPGGCRLLITVTLCEFGCDDVSYVSVINDETQEFAQLTGSGRFWSYSSPCDEPPFSPGDVLRVVTDGPGCGVSSTSASWVNCIYP